MYIALSVFHASASSIAIFNRKAHAFAGYGIPHQIQNNEQRARGSGGERGRENSMQLRNKAKTEWKI